MRAKSLIQGLLTYIPGSERFMPKRSTGGTNTARYCYGVWFKHLTMLWHHGITTMPETVAELGPGDSLGIGFCAMLSGANRYYALDVVEFANSEFNLRIFDELAEMFRTRTPFEPKGFPDFRAQLGETGFPSHILTDELLAVSLSENRLDAIRRSLKGEKVSGISLRYMVPWSDVIEPNSVDLVISHSVLEHVVDLDTTYRALNHWIRPGGVMSHQIDFSSHGLTREWNGYRAELEWVWRATMGRRPFLINREPHSGHRQRVLQNGFRLLCDLRHERDDGIPRSRLARKWREIADDDLNCGGAFMQAMKPMKPISDRRKAD